MLEARHIVLLVCLVLAIRCPLQAADESRTLTAPAEENTALRFFYQPTLSDHFHVPLIFRVVGQSDSKISTAPFTSEGRVAFVFVSEMQRLMGRMALSGVSWRGSDTIETLGSSHRLKAVGELDITVVSSKGTAKGTIEPRRICKFLASLDSAIRSSRALWEFKKFRLDYSCDVSGFDPQAYPDHYYYK